MSETECVCVNVIFTSRSHDFISVFSVFYSITFNTATKFGFHDFYEFSFVIRNKIQTQYFGFSIFFMFTN